MKIGNREFQVKGHTYVMGILNLTPDSFSDGGKWNDRDRALRHVEEMLQEGGETSDRVRISSISVGNPRVPVTPWFPVRRRLQGLPRLSGR